MRYYVLFCALVSCAAGYFLADPHDYHWESSGYDRAEVEKVNLLADQQVGRTAVDEKYWTACYVSTGFGERPEGCPSYEEIRRKIRNGDLVEDLGGAVIKPGKAQRHGGASHRDLLQRQARAYAEIYGLTNEEDMQPRKDIFGDPRHDR